MNKIQVLDRRTAELLAAGEVVERPSSVVKELIENSLDAGATAITAEIEHGGISYIRITDNGSGISRADVPTAFLRHATSKIRTEVDLDGINTLGFRGEALAAICAVSKTEVLTCDGEEIGTHYAIEGGVETEYADAGCPKGTTIIVRALFYNTPARMKFLKKDVTEGNSVASVVERLALSHPEVAFKFIRDGKTIFSTPGDNKLASAVYAVLGREFAIAQIPVEGDVSGVKVMGFTCKPANCRANRTSQYFFINGRLFKSETVAAAVEQAYKNSA
ncbi:MAG: DNA mismatch repair endonuclease MutL, partial [Clostridia bacterium]|nr:DNA mismatch repair endonuclease MutL [Clostridia bacterium]